MYLGVFRLCQPHKVFAGIVVDPVLEVFMMNHKVIFHASLFVAGLFYLLMNGAVSLVFSCLNRRMAYYKD